MTQLILVVSWNEFINSKYLNGVIEMKHIKTISNLFSKASMSYDGFAQINGRMSYGYGIVGDLEQKYAIEFDYMANTVKMWHWGTMTIEYDLSTNTVLEYYGESNSDRDSLNTLLNELGHNHEYFRWLPSKNKFYLEKGDK